MARGKEMACLDEKTRNFYLSRGIVLLGDILGKAEAIEVLARIEYLSQRRPGREVRLLINSPGGVAKYSLAIYDELRNLSVPVATGCAGMADGAAAVLLAAGTKGRRGALAHAVIHVTDVWSASDGQPTPEQFEGIEKLRERFVEIWAGCTGRTGEVVRHWMSSQKRFSADDALQAGIIDFVVPEEERDGGQEDGYVLRLFRARED